MSEHLNMIMDPAILREVCGFRTDAGLLHRPLNRRHFLRSTAVLGLGATMGNLSGFAQDRGQRPAQSGEVTVLNPRGRVPMSFIIDDSTCLVNMAHFAIPQFAQVFPDRYRQAWRDLPREIPDAFVLEFAEWCREHGVKGKYSVVPYPACVGWLDRELPGWSRRDLENSLRIVREIMSPDWDIHPEMVTHTWVINTQTGRPYPERSEYFMENWRWTDGKSVDELADYLGYALGILKRAGLTCEGITTPGGFGNRVLPELSQATLESCRSVFNTEIPHYFRHLYTDDRSVAPRVEYASGLGSGDPKCVVSIIGCTGDWFGGWDGLTPGNADRFITPDLRGGRLPEVIARGEPTIMVCHWPGLYYNGDHVGFNILKEVVRRLEERYDHLIWMKLGEIARYWAARELTAITGDAGVIRLEAPFACRDFTLRFEAPTAQAPRVLHEGRGIDLRALDSGRSLEPQSWRRHAEGFEVCFDLPKGSTTLAIET